MQAARFTTHLATATVGSLLLLGLTSCANPIDQLVQQGTEQAIERIAEESTGGQVDLDTGGGAALPEGWPDIPTPDGEVQMSMKSADTMTATFLTDQAEVDRLLEEFRSAGYEGEATMDMGDMKVYSFTGLEWFVGFTIMVDSDDSSKVSVSYVVTPAAG
ncbi:hypothetical protein [Leucobacter sp. W1153]|uniref:hypothetical protein n=1 Tax=unclassified Leucobacter TaxID=2621730 RepID=UPI003F312CF1